MHHLKMEGIAKEWTFASRSAYNRDITAMESILNQIDNPFTRTEKLQIQTGNDSMKFNYNGISQFSSVRNRSASTSLDKLGDSNPLEPTSISVMLITVF